MHKLLIASGCGLLSLTYCHAQQEQVLLQGTVLEKRSRKPVAFVHVINTTRSTGTTTTETGRFHLQAQPGDTVSFSAVGYVTTMYILKPDLGEQEVTIILRRDTTRIRPVDIHAFPPWASFKKELINMRPVSDSLDMRLIQLPKSPTLTVSSQLQPKLYFRGPFTTLYNYFNKKARTKRKIDRKREKLNRYSLTE